MPQYNCERFFWGELFHRPTVIHISISAILKLHKDVAFGLAADDVGGHIFRFETERDKIIIV